MAEGLDKPKTNTKQAVDILRAMIVDNKLAAGSNHLESELSDMLGMSRTPVREATLILEAQGLVAVKPRHGVRILALSPKDMTEIYEIITELESLSAELAATRQLPESEFKGAEKAIERMDKALGSDDREGWAEADQLFHSELVRLGGNQRIASIVNQYVDQVRRARTLTLYLRPLPTKSNKDHLAVLDAIKSGAADKARKIHKTHRLQAKDMLLNLIAKHGFHSV